MVIVKISQVKKSLWRNLVKAIQIVDQTNKEAKQNLKIKVLWQLFTCHKLKRSPIHTVVVSRSQSFQSSWISLGFKL